MILGAARVERVRKMSNPRYTAKLAILSVWVCAFLGSHPTAASLVIPTVKHFTIVLAHESTSNNGYSGKQTPTYLFGIESSSNMAPSHVSTVPGGTSGLVAHRSEQQLSLPLVVRWFKFPRVAQRAEHRHLGIFRPPRAG